MGKVLKTAWIEGLMMGLLLVFALATWEFFAFSALAICEQGITPESYTMDSLTPVPDQISPEAYLLYMSEPEEEISLI